MAHSRLCSIPGCGKPHKGHGFCAMHLLRYRKYGDPHRVVPKEQRRRPGPIGPRKYHVDPDWLRRAYHVERRRVGDIAAEIGCCVEHLNEIVAKFGIPRRDGRSGRKLPTMRKKFNLAKAIWLYEIDRLSCEDIGRIVGCHGDTVRRRLREAGISIRHHNDTKRGTPSPQRLKLDEARVVREYLKPKATLGSVAEQFGCGYGVIGRILEQRRIPRKPLAELRETPTGPEHPSWRHDLTPEERENRRDAYKQSVWRVKVYERDGFMCQRCCDDRGGNLHAHHIEGYSFNKADRWKVSNGVTLCADCHRAFHRRYGLKNFGHPQLKQFIAG